MEPDISELYAFALLARIDKAVKYIYPPGVHFTIILDGKAYDPFYGYTPEADAAYPDYLAGLVSSAGLSSVISMIRPSRYGRRATSRVRRTEAEGRSTIGP